MAGRSVLTPTQQEATKGAAIARLQTSLLDHGREAVEEQYGNALVDPVTGAATLCTRNRATGEMRTYKVSGGSVQLVPTIK